MVKRKLLIIFLSLLVAIFGCGSIFGILSVEVRNDFETGIVDIDLQEFQKVGDTEKTWEDDPVVLPGDVISKIPRIYNKGNDCFIRAKITFREITEIGETDLLGMSSDWTKADDGYYYYTKILSHGENVDIFQGLRIPNNFPQGNAGKKFFIDIDVDAIQSKNFEPQFNLAQPWGTIEILKCTKEGQYDVSSFKQSDSQSFSITYLGDVEKLVKNRDNFFGNFPYLMPGDTYSDTLKLENNSDGAIKLYFRNSATDDSDLLDKIQLKITTTINGKTAVFYEGSLRGEALNKNSVLAVLPKDASGDFTFEIHVPHELNNEYTISSSFVKWIFSTEEITNEDLDIPQTGDDFNILLWGSIGGLSVFLMALLIVLNKEDKEEENENEKVYPL